MPTAAKGAPGGIVVVDARMAGQTGIGRYVDGLLRYAGDHRDQYSFEVVALMRSNSQDHNTSRVRQIPAASRVFSAGEQVEIPSLIAKAHARLVHVPHFNAPLLTRTPVLLTIQDCAFDRVPEERPSFLAYVYYKAMMKSALSKAAKIIAASHGTRADLLDMYDLPEEKVTVIHHGIDLQTFHAAGPPGGGWAAVKARWHLDVPYVLYVGLVRPRKNIKTLLSAVRRARDSGRERFTLLLAGPRDSRFIDVPREARRVGIPDMVVQTGVVPDEELRVLYQHASMVVLPSLVEGFGFPILEGMASGTPVIASDIPVHREVAGDAALLVPPRDVDAWGDAMVRVFGDSEFAGGLRARGLERVKAFSMDVTARRTLALYEDLLSA